MLFRSLLVAALAAAVSASNVIDLTPDNFDDVVGKGKPALVEFFAPWCGHCKNLAPVYEEVADAYAHAKDKVVIAKVDADGAGRSLGKKYGVTGFPTLKWFDAEGKESDYDGGRDLTAFTTYISQKTGVKSNLAPPPPSPVLQLDLHNWEEVVMDPSKNVLVSFTAPWCGHCKNLKPHWEKVAKTFAVESDCIIANIQADDKKNSDISQKYGVTGFPTIKFFSKSNKKPKEYSGGRTEADIVAFLNKECGTKRAVGGGLNDEAGLIAEMDAIAYKFYKAAADKRQDILREATTVGSVVGEKAKPYVRIMERMLKDGIEYFDKETKRLEKMLAKKTLASSKLDELKIKKNVLQSFIDERIAESEAGEQEEEEEEETVGRDESEL